MDSNQVNQYIQDNADKTSAVLAEEITNLGFPIGERAVRKRRQNLGINKSQPLTHEQRVGLLKEKLLTDQRERASKADILTEARYELLLDTIREAVTPLEFVQVKFPEQPRNGDEESACIIISDTHFGKKNRLYDINIATQRFDTIINGLLKIIEIHRNAYPIKKLHIFWTGDIVDGESIYPTHPHHVDGHMVNQIFKPMEFVVAQLARLAENFEEVHCHCIRGNHGRISKHAHEETNWDNITYHVLRLATINIPNITWNIPLGYAQIVDVMGTKILQYHGHQIKMTLNLPWYGITTRISRWAITEQLGGFDVAIQGHFHTSSRIRWNTKQVFTNGTTVAGDDFAIENLGLEASETQWLFGVHPEKGVTWTYELRV